jgi:hypothetical protein
MPMLIGKTQCSSAGVATARPSIAPSTEMAGVMMPSPYSSADPNNPAVTSSQRARRSFIPAGSRARSARMPPSPRLSARSMWATYLNEIRKLSDQKTSERIPRMFSRFRAMDDGPRKHSFSA